MHGEEEGWGRFAAGKNYHVSAESCRELRAIMSPSVAWGAPKLCLQSLATINFVPTNLVIARPLTLKSSSTVEVLKLGDQHNLRNPPGGGEGGGGKDLDALTKINNTICINN